MPVVVVEKQTPQITLLTLNRPEQRNAISIELLIGLADAISAVENDPAQRILMLRGAGAVFCAGLDLKEARDLSRAKQSAELVGQCLVALSETRLVTLALVHGAAIAGGAGLMSACDFVVATQGSKIGYPEVRRGLVAGLVMTFLRRQLRERDIRELLLTSELIDAERARQIGLVNRVVPEKDLMTEARKIADAVLQGAPGALTNSKRLLAELWPTSVRDDVTRALRDHMQARESGEAKEGIAAFAEKRQPNWLKT
jgi:Enoyl-CoA hydratase/carnithine racemase